MPSRVHLSRIIAINWYGYRRFIDVSGLSLITGANGSGKSVLLDLIQFVMLGESLSRFNKAAAGAGSGRSLRGYCLCDTNTQGADGQERYLRPSGVTLAALEFVWPQEENEETPRRETWGARIEFEGPSSKGKTLWFTIPQRMEKDDFLGKDLLSDDLTFMPEDEFRVHVKRDLGGEVFDRQGSYLEEMSTRSHLGFDRPQMNKTLPNSMAFQPVESFEKFIREYLLEPGMPDVKAVRASVDAHRRAQDRLEKMHDQLERLKRIGNFHTEYRKARREARLHAHLLDALTHERRLETLNEERGSLENRRTENSEQRADYESAMRERNELDSQLNKVRLTAGNDLQTARLNEARVQQDEINRDLEALREIEKSAQQFLYERTQNWKQWLRLAEDLELSPQAQTNDWLKAMQGGEENAALDAAAKMPRAYQALVNEARDHLRPLEEKIKDLESRETRLRRELDDLDHKGSSVPSPLLDALKSRGQKADALARVIEVKEDAEPWWPLLETLLGKHRSSVLPQEYKAAWDQAQRLGHLDEPLVNPDELGTASGSPKKGTVASFFETEHDLASSYLHHLYGDLIAVETAAETENHSRAISRDGWLKDPPHRQPPPAIERIHHRRGRPAPPAWDAQRRACGSHRGTLHPPARPRKLAHVPASRRELGTRQSRSPARHLQAPRSSPPPGGTRQAQRNHPPARHSGARSAGRKTPRSWKQNSAASSSAPAASPTASRNSIFTNSRPSNPSPISRPTSRNFSSNASKAANP